MTRNITHPDNDEEIEARVDETLKETFPASDPPAWTLGTDHSIKTSNCPDEEAEPDTPSREAEGEGGRRER